MTTYQQQSWNPQYNVTILDNGTVTLNGTSLKNAREVALANIIVRLNAHILLAEQELKITLKELLPLQN